MAKKPKQKTYGKEVIRLVKTHNKTQVSEWSREVISYREDGTILRKKTLKLLTGGEYTWKWRVWKIIPTTQLSTHWKTMCEKEGFTRI
jgi:hypothetical protein